MTVFITISRGIIARNLLQNEFYSLVKGHFSKVVLLTTAAHDERFKKEFSAPNVEIIPMPDEPDGFWDEMISRLNKMLIFNESTMGHGLYRYAVPPSRLGWAFKFLRFTLLRVIFLPLSKITLLRRASQRLDYLCLQRPAVRKYQALLDAYAPDVVFVGNMLEESALLKAARRKGISTVAMPKTWDNPSKRYFRARADHVIAWSSFMKDEMTALQDYLEGEVTVVGVPQFDYYADHARRESREEFCARSGLDPNKKILFFGSEGNMVPSDADMARLIYGLIEKNAFAESCQLFIRPHFAYKNDEKKFSALVGKPGVIVDGRNRPSDGFSDRWDYSEKQMDHFLNTLCHADVIMSTASTLALDAAALGRPALLIAFDGPRKKLFYQSVARYYICDYLHEYLRYSAAPMVRDAESLCKSVNAFCADSGRFQKEQERLCERLCYRLDGKTGKRLFECLKEIAGKRLNH